jgi:hypothetical protein
LVGWSLPEGNLCRFIRPLYEFDKTKFNGSCQAFNVDLRFILRFFARNLFDDRWNRFVTNLPTIRF